MNDQEAILDVYDYCRFTAITAVQAKLTVAEVKTDIWEKAHPVAWNRVM